VILLGCREKPTGIIALVNEGRGFERVERHVQLAENGEEVPAVDRCLIPGRGW
jgi:hypothetical protein